MNARFESTYKQKLRYYVVRFSNGALIYLILIQNLDVFFN